LQRFGEIPRSRLHLVKHPHVLDRDQRLFDQLGEVDKRSRQPVYLVDDDDVDLAGADVVKQSLEVRPVGRPT
jgi:hypothetical protein